jgi:hypothetical protein
MCHRSELFHCTITDEFCIKHPNLNTDELKDVRTSECDRSMLQYYKESNSQTCSGSGSAYTLEDINLSIYC